MVEMLVVCRKVSMACTGGDESAKYPTGKPVLAGAAFLCMGSDNQGFVGWGALLTYAIYVSVRSHCFASRRRYAGDGGMLGLYIEDPSFASLSASSFPTIPEWPGIQRT